MVRFSPGRVTLSDIGDGTLQAGIVPIPRIRRSEAFAQNAGIVTVLNAATSIIIVDMGTVVALDRVLGFAFWVMTKGATGGLTRMRIQKSSGTATVEWIGPGVTPDFMIDPQNAFTESRGVLGFIGKVTVGGTLFLELSGLSSGSNGSVPASFGGLHGWAFPGS